MFVLDVDEHAMLVVIFKASVSVGVVKYYAIPASERIAEQIKAAHERDPDSGLDLSVLNVADPSDFFRKKA
jgi:hypothetical protein